MSRICMLMMSNMIKPLQFLRETWLLALFYVMREKTNYICVKLFSEEV